jgi:hypothetical protein
MCQSNVASLSDDDFPNIDNPVRISSLQLQRALAFVVQEYNYEILRVMAADPRIRAESKAAVTVTVAASGCGAPAAGTFLRALPRTGKPELRLPVDEISFRDARASAACQCQCHRFRLPNMHPSRVHGHGHGDISRCPCGARPDLAGASQ